MSIQLTDIRCGCGGLCDAFELCPMRSHAPRCDCDLKPVHMPTQHDIVVIWKRPVGSAS
jgi:hypothetical protein